MQQLIYTSAKCTHHSTLQDQAVSCQHILVALLCLASTIHSGSKLWKWQTRNANRLGGQNPPGSLFELDCYGPGKYGEYESLHAVRAGQSGIACKEANIEDQSCTVLQFRKATSDPFESRCCLFEQCHAVELSLDKYVGINYNYVSRNLCLLHMVW